MGSKKPATYRTELYRHETAVTKQTDRNRNAAIVKEWQKRREQDGAEYWYGAVCASGFKVGHNGSGEEEAKTTGKGR